MRGGAGKGGGGFIKEATERGPEDAVVERETDSGVAFGFNSCFSKLKLGKNLRGPDKPESRRHT